MIATETDFRLTSKPVEMGDTSSQSFNTVSQSLRTEKRYLDDENDAIKQRIAHLVDRLEGKLHASSSSNLGV